MMPQNRPSDLTDQRRNSFGLIFPNHSYFLGTKGDVQTFFLILNDLVSQGDLDNAYGTVSNDLYRTLVNKNNLEYFKVETARLQVEFSKICPSNIDWTLYPYNRERGHFDYQQFCIDPTKPNLLDVFWKFFAGFEKAPYWIEESLLRNGKYSRLVVAPTEIRTSRKFRKFKDEDFIDAESDPLWLREPE